jgi:hypothetical protein
VKIAVEANFDLNTRGISSLVARGIRELRSQATLHFFLDSFPTIIEKQPEPELRIKATYKFSGRMSSDDVTFFLADIAQTTIFRSPMIDVLKSISERTQEVARELVSLRKDFGELSKMVDGSGLRISYRTLQILRNSGELFDPHEFDWDGYRIILDISTKEAFSLHRIFGTFGSGEKKRKEYDDLPPALRAKFEKLFKVEF